MINVFLFVSIASAVLFCAIVASIFKSDDLDAVLAIVAIIGSVVAGSVWISSTAMWLEANMSAHDHFVTNSTECVVRVEWERKNWLLADDGRTDVFFPGQRSVLPHSRVKFVEFFDADGNSVDAAGVSNAVDVVRCERDGGAPGFREGDSRRAKKYTCRR